MTLLLAGIIVCNDETLYSHYLSLIFVRLRDTFDLHFDTISNALCFIIQQSLSMLCIWIMHALMPL